MKKVFVWFIPIILFCVSCVTEPTFKVAVVAPFSLESGKDLWQALLMASAELEQRGGMEGRRLELFPVDEQDNVDKSVGNLRQVLLKHKIDLIVGGFNSAAVLALMDVMAEYGVIWLGTGGAHPAVIEKIKNNYEKYQYYFRVGTPDAREQGKAFAQFAREVFGPRYGYKRFAILAPNSKWARFLMNEAKESLLQDGFQLKYEGYFSPTTLNFKPVLNSLKKSGAEFYFATSLGKQGELFIQQVREEKVKLAHVWSHTILSEERLSRDLGKEIENATWFRLSAVDYAFTPKTLLFVNAYKKTYGKNPGILAYPAYDTLFIMREAVRKAGGFEKKELIKALEALEYSGNNLYKFTPEHDLTYGIKDNKRYVLPIFFQWQSDGKRYAIWPAELRTADYQHPGLR